MSTIKYRSSELALLSDLLGTKFNPAGFYFSDLLHTSNSSLAFWNGSAPITVPLSGVVLVDSSEVADRLKRLLSENPSLSKSKPIIHVCSGQLPVFFWQLMDKLVIPYIDNGEFCPAGDSYTHFANHSYWRS